MFPETHLVTSWVIGAKTTDNARDCRLVALAGILPDADGLGILIDAANKALGYKKTLFYEHYHHYLLHGALGAILIAVLLACFARHKWRVALLALAVFHLHLLCDFVGSRGPSPEDLWPIFYLGPFDKEPMWIWKGQWPLDAWPNRMLAAGFFLYALWLAVQKGYSFVGVFSRRLDERFVAILRKWQGALAGVRSRPLLLVLTATLALTSFPAGAAGVSRHEGRPAFINEDSAFSMSIQERCFMGKPMEPVVRETRAGVIRNLGKTSVVGLYVGYPQR